MIPVERCMFHVKHILMSIFIFTSFIMKRFTSPHQKIGLHGEQLAYEYLVSQGYSCLEKNFSCKFGEIDLIMKQGSVIHFFEVKTITLRSYADDDQIKDKRQLFRMQYGTVQNPFQNITYKKKCRLQKTAEYFLLTHGLGATNNKFQIDGLGITLNQDHEKIQYTIIPNIII